VEEALDNARDALAAVVEAYDDLGRALPTDRPS
jgi:predicted RNase H-like HicB family nuclease